MKDFYPILERSPLFEAISVDDLRGLLGCIGGRVVEVEKGQAIMREGDPATHIGLVLSGAVQLVREDYYGNRSIVAHITPGQLF